MSSGPSRKEMQIGLDSRLSLPKRKFDKFEGNTTLKADKMSFDFGSRNTTDLLTKQDSFKVSFKRNQLVIESLDQRNDNILSTF